MRRIWLVSIAMTMSFVGTLGCQPTAPGVDASTAQDVAIAQDSTPPFDIGPLTCGTMTCAAHEVCIEHSGGVDTGMGRTYRCFDPVGCPPLHDCDTGSGNCATFTCLSPFCSITGGGGSGSMTIHEYARRVSCGGI